MNYRIEPRRIAWLLLALAALTPASAQLVVELPFDPGIPERVVVSKSWSEPTSTRSQPVTTPPASAAANIKVPQAVVPPATTLPIPNTLAAIVAPVLDPVPQLTPLRAIAYYPPSPPSSIVISAFNGDTASGAVVSGSSWDGNVTQGPGYITIGGTATDVNGWRATHVSLDATGMSFITITAQRDPGNAASSLFLQFEDRLLHPQVFSLSTANFAVGTPTQVQIVLGTWSGEFDFTQIASWSIGGGAVGENSFRMTLHHVEFGTTAIPEPATNAAIIGLAAIGAALYRRRRK